MALSANCKVRLESKKGMKKRKREAFQITKRRTYAGMAYHIRKQQFDNDFHVFHFFDFFGLKQLMENRCVPERLFLKSYFSFVLIGDVF